MPGILVVDDHSLVRSGLRTLFQEEAPQYIFGEAADGQSALARCRTEPWDVALLDVSMPGMGGLDLLRRLRAECPGLRVIMLSFGLEHDHVRQAFEAGALGYVAKEDLPDHLLPALQFALAGRVYVSPAVEAVLLQSDAPGAALSQPQ